MEPEITNALKSDRIVDITTIGRMSGEPRRKEIALIALPDGTYVIAGSPGPRSWYANLRARPDFTVHVKRSAQADLPAKATAITDPGEKGALVAAMAQADPQRKDIDQEAWVARSALVRVEFPGPPAC